MSTPRKPVRHIGVYRNLPSHGKPVLSGVYGVPHLLAMEEAAEFPYVVRDKEKARIVEKFVEFNTAEWTFEALSDADLLELAIDGKLEGMHYEGTEIPNTGTISFTALNRVSSLLRNYGLKLTFDVAVSYSSEHKLTDAVVYAAILHVKEDTESTLKPCDNPSGEWCKGCRGAKMSHCSDPINCGGMEPMRHHKDCQHWPKTEITCTPIPS